MTKPERQQAASCGNKEATNSQTARVASSHELPANVWTHEATAAGPSEEEETDLHTHTSTDTWQETHPQCVRSHDWMTVQV